MDTEALYQSLRLTNEPHTKLLLLVLDGLGDLATSLSKFLTPLEAARTPNLDELAKASAMGRMIPVAPGITPGSGPGHLGLFGYDPLQYEVGRGVIEALGLGIDLRPGDVAARANFCTLDEKGIVTDRRAGRIPTDVNERLCEKLRKIKKIDSVEFIIKPGKSHRFVVVLRGKGIEGPLSDSDPHHEGEAIKKIQALSKSVNEQCDLPSLQQQMSLLLKKSISPTQVLIAAAWLYLIDAIKLDDSMLDDATISGTPPKSIPPMGSYSVALPILPRSPRFRIDSV